jgi:hypothetical protein
MNTSKKPSLAAALHTFNRSPQAPSTEITQKPRAEPRPIKTRAFPVPPSRASKKALIGYFDPAVSKQLKQIGLDKDLSVQDLLGEAINDLFQKYKKPTIA